MSYPEHVVHEMRDMEELTRSLICLDGKQALEWFENHHVTVVESDIWICEEDAILKVLAVKEHHKQWGVLDDTEEMI